MNATTAASSPLREPLLLQHHPDDDDEEERQEEDALEEEVEHHVQYHHHHHAPPVVPWYRNSLQVMAMLSNYSTSYNVVNISLVLPILEQLLKDENNANTRGTTTSTTATTTTNNADSGAMVASSLLAGMMIGQVMGGALGDASCLGLSRALLLVMMVQIMASLGSAICVPSPHSFPFSSSSFSSSSSCSSTNDYCSSNSTTAAAVNDLYWSLAAFRFVLGIAAGAVYPLAACLSVEQGINTDQYHHYHHPHHPATSSSSSSSRRSSISIGGVPGGAASPRPPPPPFTTTSRRQQQLARSSMQEQPESSSSLPPPLRQVELPHPENDADADAFSQIRDEHEQETNHQRNQQQQQQVQPQHLFLLQQQQQQYEVESAQRRVVWTFCTQGLGFWSVPFLATILLFIMPVTKLDLVWRILLGWGSVPGFVLVYLQIQLYRHRQQQRSRARLDSVNVSHGDFISLVPNNDNDNSNNENAIDSIHVNIRQHDASINSDQQQNRNNENVNITDVLQQQQQQHDCKGRCHGNAHEEPEENTTCHQQHEAIQLGGDSDTRQENGNHEHPHNNNDFRDSLQQTCDGSNDVISDDNHGDNIAAPEETVRDCELRCDSDGEVGTLLDSNSSSVGVYRAASSADQQQHVSMIRLGWWASLTSEPDLVRKLVGTAGTWFLFDVLFYGNTLFQPIVTEAAFGPRKEESPLHLLQRTATDSLLLTSIALPGYFVAALVMGRSCCPCRTWGMKPIVQTPRFVMLQGFAVMAILYGTIGLRWKTLQQHNPIILMLLYSLTFFFANYGPNTTTFILPSLVFSPECRSTLNGLAAAGGKAGALAGATFFAPAAETWGDATVMLICSAVAVVAFIMTQLFVQIPNNNHNHHTAPAAAS